VVLSRAKFKVTEKRFDDLLSLTYDDEIKNKYIPELHQSNSFERTKLNDIINFLSWKNKYLTQIDLCLEYLTKFKDGHDNFYQVLQAESINVIKEDHPFISEINVLYKNTTSIESSLSTLRNKFNQDKYQVLNEIPQIANISHGIAGELTFKRGIWSEFLNKNPSVYFDIQTLYHHHKGLFYNLSELNQMFDDLRDTGNHKVIVGKAGTGKTHITAHLINKIRLNSDYVIFLKSKQFNGDNVNFDDRLLQLLQIPTGYILSEVLEKLNMFSKANNKRCFILIDALNETTKSSIGFSNIWAMHLQTFINQIKLYSHLYFICTLRTSYIDEIWSTRPENIIEISGFDNDEDVEEACEKYFDYYKINATNLDTADLSYFEVPLLLDLFCKLTNPKREIEIDVALNIHSYLQIFENYISELITEVKNKLGLLKNKRIVYGFSEIASKFLNNNESVVSVEDFEDAFDENDLVTKDNSISRVVLEGYLIFIKDFVEIRKEVVKHTQQEIGGYLLAKKLSEDFASITDLIIDKSFNEKITGDDKSKHHQLRLDILKFLIAIRPEIIEHLKDKDGLKLSWWYLYNGLNYNFPTDIPDKLLEEEKSKFIVPDILRISSKFWFIPKNSINFDFVSQVLNKLDLWEFETNWTYYIYKNADSFYEFIEQNIQEIKEGREDDYSRSVLIAKFISLITSTNIRELRDLATIYLIEFGKRHPILLLEITEYSSTLKDSYIYERLASCCYGVALILQNDEQYVNEHLPLISRRLYNLQFADNPLASVYNYIVIDSIKHLLDLAIFKNVSDFDEYEIRRFSNYEFLPPYEWTLPTDEQFRLINQSSHMSWPEPIGMDFGIYTIPRLMIQNHVDDRKAISNVYKRIFELGYRDLEKGDFTDETFREFYRGKSIIGYEGKVDKLGKKYSWKGFFDYAGFLLLNKELNVFEEVDTAKKHYSRLSDVDIDICLPNQNYKFEKRIYNENLLAERDLNLEWYKVSNIDKITPLFEFEINKENYIMLFGKIDQKLNDDYKIRSFLLAQTFFIKKDLQIDILRQNIVGKVFDWDDDVHFSADQLRNVYFGEMYWADNFLEQDLETIKIPTGVTVKRKKKISFMDTVYFEEYSEKDIGKEIEKIYPEKLHFLSEPTLSEYLWESNSKVFNGYSEQFPSIKMGKYLELKSDPSSGKILDTNLNECFSCIDYKDEDNFSNSFNYMRSDLVRKYMDENNLLLVYQVKQHSYDTNNDHNRGMKFYILE
jgi:hypothetical protein